VAEAGGLSRSELLSLADTVVEELGLLGYVVDELKSDRIDWDELTSGEMAIMTGLAERNGELGAFFLQKMFNMRKKETLQKQDENENVLPSKKISEKIEELTNKMSKDVNISKCKDETEVDLKRLKVIGDNVDMMKGVKILDSVLTSLKESVGVKDENEVEAKDEKTENVITHARSLKEITDKVCEFEYREFKEDGNIICIVCGEHFAYSNQLPRDFGGSKLIPKFKNLKAHLKQHFKTKKHQTKALEVQALALMGSKEESRSLKISGRIGRISYFVVKNGRPYTDFTQLVYICKINGSDMGDINHSL
jgi:hypothetical protein